MQQIGKPAEGAGALFNYSPADHLGAPFAVADANIAGSPSHNSDVALRSQPAKITRIRNPRTGSISYRVTVTIAGKQRKRQFRDLNDAKEQQEEWETERSSAAAGPRPRLTRLTYEKLHEAEAANVTLDGTGYTVTDAVRHLLRNPPAKRAEILFADGCNQFLLEKDGHDPTASLKTTVRHSAASRDLSALLASVMSLLKTSQLGSRR